MNLTRQKMLDYIFLDKDTCLFCKNDYIKNHFLCKSCLDKLDFVDNDFDILGYRAHNLYFYNDFSKKLIGDYKFNRNTSLYRVFGSMLKEYMEKKNIFDHDYVLTVPSSKSIVKKRGFNHVRLISDYFLDKNLYLDSFKKIKNTKAQHNLSREDRTKNLRSSFTINEDLKDKKILILDDIITSSATMKEVIKTLIKKNPKNIQILALFSSHKIKK